MEMHLSKMDREYGRLVTHIEGGSKGGKHPADRCLLQGCESSVDSGFAGISGVGPQTYCGVFEASACREEQGSAVGVVTCP